MDSVILVNFLHNKIQVNYFVSDTIINMNLENQQQSKREIIQNPEIEAINNPEDLERFFTFTDPVIGVDWGEEGVLQDYTPEYIASHPEITQIFVAKNDEGQIVAGAKAKMLDDAEKVRLGLESSDFKNQIGALLEYAAVKKEYRNNKLLADLTKKRIDWAKEHKATYVCSEAEITNPISIYTKIRDGFVLASVQEPAPGAIHPYFVEIKNLNPNENEISGNNSNSSIPEWKEVVVTEKSFEELKKLFADGWRGVDIKGADEEPEKLSVPWTLIMER